MIDKGDAVILTAILIVVGIFSAFALASGTIFGNVTGLPASFPDQCSQFDDERGRGATIFLNSNDPQEIQGYLDNGVEWELEKTSTFGFGLPLGTISEGDAIVTDLGQNKIQIVAMHGGVDRSSDQCLITFREKIPPQPPSTPTQPTPTPVIQPAPTHTCSNGIMVSSPSACSKVSLTPSPVQTTQPTTSTVPVTQVQDDSSLLLISGIVILVILIIIGIIAIFIGNGSKKKRRRKR